MTFLFLIAATYLIVEYLNYSKSKLDKEEAAKNSFEKLVDKATKLIEQAIQEIKESFRTPAKKSVVDIQSLETIFTSTMKVDSLKDALKVEEIGSEVDPVIALESKISFDSEESDNDQIPAPIFPEV